MTPRARNPRWEPGRGGIMIPVAGKSGTGTGERPRFWQLRVGDCVGWGRTCRGRPGASPISADPVVGWDSRPRSRTNRGRGRGRGRGSGRPRPASVCCCFALSTHVTLCLLPFRGLSGFWQLVFSFSVMLARWLLTSSSSAAVTGPRGPLNSQPAPESGHRAQAWPMSRSSSSCPAVPRCVGVYY